MGPLIQHLCLTVDPLSSPGSWINPKYLGASAAPAGPPRDLQQAPWLLPVRAVVKVSSECGTGTAVGPYTGTDGRLSLEDQGDLA